MRVKRNTNLLFEPPSVATGDIAFNLLIFFLVCASNEPENGRRQDIPRSEKQEQKQQAKNIEVSLTRTTVSVGEEGAGLQKTSLTDLPGHLRRLLAARSRPEERVVVVKSAKDTPYQHWITVTALVEKAGGTITLQMSEDREVVVP